MALRDDGRSRTPGPLGNIPAGVGGRQPGPLRFGPWVMADAAVTTAAVKTLIMPRSPNDNYTKVARVLTWPLGKDKPVLEDVHQQHLANCGLAATLAALAYTVNGRPRIRAMIEEHSGTVVTDLSNVLDQLEEQPKDGNTITSNCSFKVGLGKGSAEVSDVFYTDDGAGDSWSMIYMDSPHKQLWPCVIEKAYAVLLGNDYVNLNSFTIDEQKPYLPVQEIWHDIVGKDAVTTPIKKDTDLSQFASGAKSDVTKVPTIAASWEGAKKVTGSHGFAVLGISGSTISLLDPDTPTTISLSLQDFLSNFQQILSGNP
jgi:hypothetical protein